MSQFEVEAYLIMLTNNRKVLAPISRLPSNALLFHHGEVLGQDLPWIGEIGRLVPKRSILPVKP